MIRTCVKVSGMVCGMCETHVNDAICSAFTVRKVRSSRVKGETVIESDNPIDTDKLKQVINATGYIVLSVNGQETTKKERTWRLWRK